MHRSTRTFTRLRQSSVLTPLLLCCLVYLVLPCVVFAQETPAMQDNAPVISLPESDYDFGKVRQGERVEKTFTIRNLGKSRLDIHGVKGNQNILKVTLSQTSIESMQSAELHVKLNTSKVSGRVNTKIAINSSDPMFAEEVITLTGTVVPLLALSTSSLFAGQIGQHQAFTQKVGISGSLVDGGRLRSLKITTSSPGVTAGFVGAGSKTPLLKVTLQPDLKAGTFNESVTLTSQDPPAQATVALLGYKLGDIRVRPDRFEFFPETVSKSKVQTIELECAKPFRIVKVVDRTKQLEIKVETLQKDKQYRISARLTVPLPAALLGLVQVHTDLESNPLLDIPVVGGGSSNFGRPSGQVNEGDGVKP